MSCDCQVTHVVAGQVGSDKYHVACELRLPVLLPSWVESCWEACLLGNLVSATDQAVLDQHLCRPFTGCTITVTGLDEGSRSRVKEGCQKNGGNYSGELTKGVCTHLLVGSKTSKATSFLSSSPFPPSLFPLLPSLPLPYPIPSLSIVRQQVFHG